MSDNTQKPLVSAKLNGDGSVTTTQVIATLPGGPASIHGDARGELYISMTNGTIYQIEAGP
jgi:hypothetical protein